MHSIRTTIMGISAVLFASVVSSAARADEHRIVQQNKSFSVTTVEAKVGDTLLFTNMEKDIEHNIYSLTPGNDFELKLQAPGQTDRVVLDPAKHKPGTMLVECAIHPKMKLKVVIK